MPEGHFPVANEVSNLFDLKVVESTQWDLFPRGSLAFGQGAPSSPIDGRAGKPVTNLPDLVFTLTFPSAVILLSNVVDLPSDAVLDSTLFK